MNTKVLDNYKSFFADQVKEEIEEQKTINRSLIPQLFKKFDELSLAYVDRIQQETGLVILKCPRNMAPRLKVQKALVVIKKNAFNELGTRPTEWNCKWEDFCKNATFHSPESSVTPMYYVQGKESSYDYVACAGISSSLYDLFVKTTSEGKSLSVLIYNPFPPVDYYKNMSNYIDLFSSNEELYLEPKIRYEDWHPEELAFDSSNPDGISDAILTTLDEKGCCIMQGPPGSGKSYTIAKIIAKYLEEGKTVCATTMANKGLIELIKQKPLQHYPSLGKVSKTNLSIDEKKQISGIHAATPDLQVPPGELLCATNYVLSKVYSKEKISLYGGTPNYDLIVIEEASQAFLTSIAAFKQLGTKCLIVGDPMQLPPIVKLNNPIYNSWNVNTQIEGLKTYALGSDIKSFRIVSTFRLTDKSAALTKTFYSNRFFSVKDEYKDYSSAGSPLFPNDGGVLYYCTNDLRNGEYSESADNIIRFIVETMEKHFPERKLAIISPFKNSVKELQRLYATSDKDLDITIETIDRIQGITVDYAIVYIPGRNPGFALEDRRFNVATSRSESTTIIISDAPVSDFHSTSPTVIQFINKCDSIKDIAHVEQRHQKIVHVEKEEQTISTPEPSTGGLKIVGKIDLSKFERPKKELKSDKKNYYIIDTNVFVRCPDIIGKIDKKYPIILSAKVADELDKMKIKLDEQGKQNAEKALRNLNKEESRELIYELADVSLLPDDYDKRSPDNMILSVALKYKDDNPIMLTSDNGLQLKSKIMGISTISLKNFLKR